MTALERAEHQIREESQIWKRWKQERRAAIDNLDAARRILSRNYWKGAERAFAVMEVRISFLENKV